MSDRTEMLARIGYGARGLVYVLLGGLALSAAIAGGRSEGEGTTEALASLVGQPFGRVALGLVAVGLLLFVLWRLCQAVLDADHRKHTAEGYLTRALQGVSALGNGALALAAARMALAGAPEQGGDGEQDFAQWAMMQPFGPWLVGAVGLGVIGSGIVAIWYGTTRGYEKRMAFPPSRKTLFDAIAMAGLSARGVVFAIIGGFLVYAGFTVSPEEAAGLDDAMGFVRGLPFGGVLYGVVAAGLVAFGLYAWLQARYRRIDAPDEHDVRRAIR